MVSDLRPGGRVHRWLASIEADIGIASAARLERESA